MDAVKPTVRLDDANGVAYELLSLCRRALKGAGLDERADEITHQFHVVQGDFKTMIGVCREFVELV